MKKSIMTIVSLIVFSAVIAVLGGCASDCDKCDKDNTTRGLAK